MVQVIITTKREQIPTFRKQQKVQFIGKQHKKEDGIILTAFQLGKMKEEGIVHFEPDDD